MPSTPPTRQALLELRLSAEETQFFLSHGATVDASVVIRGPRPIIRSSPGSRLQIGAHSVLNSDNDTSFVPIASCVKFALGKDAAIVVGRHSDLNGCCITAYEQVEVGSYVQIGPGSWITDTDLHAIDPFVRRAQLEGRPYDWTGVARSPVVIEDDVWLGANVVVLKGVRIGRGSVVGVGSVVAFDIPPMSIAAGNPARVIKHITVKD
jgi:acetyltransferase-like isoleucine patch superfamily enzyme